MKKKILMVGILTAFAFLGCTEDEIVKPSYYSTPVISKTTNSFAYTLSADYYTQTIDFDRFTGKLNIALAKNSGN